jgi:hypothetical protein
MKIRCCAALALLALPLAACSSNTAAGRDAEVRANLTPELHTLSQRPVDVDNRQLLTMDEDLRMANEDLQHLFLLDRPSRLNRARIPR